MTFPPFLARLFKSSAVSPPIASFVSGITPQNFLIPSLPVRNHQQHYEVATVAYTKVK